MNSKVEIIEGCTICLDSITNEGKINGCLHTFCANCILEWSKVTNLCPICKKKFSEVVEVNESKDQESPSKLGQKRKNRVVQVHDREQHVPYEHTSMANFMPNMAHHMEEFFSIPLPLVIGMGMRRMVDDYENEDEEDEDDYGMAFPFGLATAVFAAINRGSGFSFLDHRMFRFPPTSNSSFSNEIIDLSFESEEPEPRRQRRGRSQSVSSSSASHLGPTIPEAAFRGRGRLAPPRGRVSNLPETIDLVSSASSSSSSSSGRSVSGDTGPAISTNNSAASSTTAGARQSSSARTSRARRHRLRRASAEPR